MNISRIILVVVAATVFSIYGYKSHQFHQEVKQRRAEHSMDFLEKFKAYDPDPTDCQLNTRKALREKDFARLDELAAIYAAERGVPGKDRNNICDYFDVLATEGNKKTRIREIKVLEQWLEQRPDSTPAKVALAEILTKYAWDARGDGFANTVSDEQFHLFYQRLHQAVEILKTIPEDQRLIYPECYGEFITCARGLTIPKDEFKELYQEATAASPKCVDIHYSAAHFTTPQWGGKPGEWEANLRNALKSLPNDAAAQVYAATICRMIKWGHWHNNYKNIFKPANIDPKKFIRGLELLVDNTPEDAPIRIYYLTAMAFAITHYYNDPIASRDAYKAADWQYDLKIWHTEKHFDHSAREWFERRFKAYNEEIDEYESDGAHFILFR